MKHLILLKILNMMDMEGLLLQWFKILLIKKASGGAATLSNKSAIKNENISNK